MKKDEVYKACRAAIECAQALDMPAREGIQILEKHGWTQVDRFELPATKFVAGLQEQAIGMLDKKEANN